MKSYLLLITTLVFSFHTFASNNHKPKNTLSVDSVTIPHSNLRFENDGNIYPKQGDFTIASYVLMSSESGERWATITFKNESSGQRFLSKDHVMAIFADGARRTPKSLRQRLDGHENLTVTLFFGKHKFPILSIFTDHSY
ncbi:hypothetical protein [Pleionea sp. CnH1-48]|uniref:hypothetical protein n=1 Tax=Pleionea sp. CnH1-48 TaxID=2954494 RepID=UPI002098450D|nr:hypothetical protein [Pleionea sp. CnH1-48]MCO7226188.1 hypothetical protein [Pleionea sp. CnH1-48]